VPLRRQALAARVRRAGTVAGYMKDVQYPPMLKSVDDAVDDALRLTLLLAGPVAGRYPSSNFVTAHLPLLVFA